MNKRLECECISSAVPRPNPSHFPPTMQEQHPQVGNNKPPPNSIYIPLKRPLNPLSITTTNLTSHPVAKRTRSSTSSILRKLDFSIHHLSSPVRHVLSTPETPLATSPPPTTTKLTTCPSNIVQPIPILPQPSLLSTQSCDKVLLLPLLPDTRQSARILPSLTTITTTTNDASPSHASSSSNSAIPIDPALLLHPMNVVARTRFVAPCVPPSYNSDRETNTCPNTIMLPDSTPKPCNTTTTTPSISINSARPGEEIIDTAILDVENVQQGAVCCTSAPSSPATTQSTEPGLIVTSARILEIETGRRAASTTSTSTIINNSDDEGVVVLAARTGDGGVVGSTTTTTTSISVVGIHDLPTDVLLRIFGFLTGPALARCESVCKVWRTEIRDTHKSVELWKTICYRHGIIPQHFRRLDRERLHKWRMNPRRLAASWRSFYIAYRKFVCMYCLRYEKRLRFPLYGDSVRLCKQCRLLEPYASLTTAQARKYFKFDPYEALRVLNTVPATMGCNGGLGVLYRFSQVYKYTEKLYGKKEADRRADKTRKSFGIGKMAGQFPFLQDL